MSNAHAEQDMLQVLQAERDAEQYIRNCENEAQQIINDMQIRVQRINVHADQRISNMEMRHAHKLNQLIINIEKECAVELGYDARQHYDKKRLQVVIEKLATELCQGKTTSGGESGVGK